MAYSGYLEPYTSTIVRLFDGGHSLEEIAITLDDCGVQTSGTHNYVKVSGDICRLRKMVRYVLIRQGRIIPKRKPKAPRLALGFWAEMGDRS